MSEWKYVRLEFNNTTIVCATNGEIIRLRKSGMRSVEGKLESINGKMTTVLRMETDAVFHDPHHIELTEWPEEPKSQTYLGRLLTKMFGG